MNGLDAARIITIANQRISQACRIDGRGLTGGVLIVADPHGIILCCEIGFVPAQHFDMFRGKCLENVKLLQDNPCNISSAQNQHPDQERHDGAVRTDDDLIFSFFGLSGSINEAFSAKIAHQAAAGMGLFRWRDICRESNNPHMKPDVPGYIV